MPAVARKQRSGDDSFLGLDSVFRLDPATLRCKDAGRWLDSSPVSLQQPKIRHDSEMASHAGSSLQTLKFVPPGGHRACANCSLAKAKCITPDDATKCERCQRMNKECVAKSKPTRKKKQATDLLGTSAAESRSGRKPRSRQPSSSPSVTTTRLCDEVIVGVGTASHPHRQRSEISTPSSPESHQPLNERTSLQLQQNSPGSASYTVDGFLDQNPDLAADADNLIMIYSRYQEPHCPFLGSHTNASSLRQENELLFLSILMAASFHNRAQQQRIANCCVQVFIDSMQQVEKRNLKLLEGVIGFLAWAHVNIQNDSQLTNVLHLTMTLASEVQLTMNPPPAQIDPLLTEDEMNTPELAKENTGASYVEQCRALARVYFIATIASQLMSPSLVMEWTMSWSQQLEDACALLERQESDADACLVAALARLVHVTDQMMTPCGRLDQGSSSQPCVDVENAEILLDNFMSRLPPRFNNSNFFRLHLLSSQIHLYNLSILDSTTPNRPILVSKTRSQAELQLRCVEAVSTFSELFHSITPSFFICLPATVWLQIHQTGSVVSAMAITPQLGWSAEFLPSSILPEHYKERLAAAFEQASLSVSTMRPGISSHDNIFDLWAADSRSQSSESSFGFCTYKNLLATLTDDENNGSLGFGIDMAKQQQQQQQHMSTTNLPQTPQAPQQPMMMPPSNIAQTHHDQQLNSQQFGQMSIQEDPSIWPSTTTSDWNPWLSTASSDAFLAVSAQNFVRGQQLPQHQRTGSEEQQGEFLLSLWQGVEHWWPQTTSPP